MSSHRCSQGKRGRESENSRERRVNHHSRRVCVLLFSNPPRHGKSAVVRVSKSPTRTVHFPGAQYDSISLGIRINTSSSPMYLGCWTDYEHQGPPLQRLSSMCIVRGVARWRGTAFAPSTGVLFQVRLAVGRVGEKLRIRVTISAHFPVRASSGVAVSSSGYKAAPEMQLSTAPPSDGPKHPATAFKSNRVSQFFLNPKSGICKTRQ